MYLSYYNTYVWYKQICSLDYTPNSNYHISLINTAFSISILVRYYLNTNNIDIVVIFISSAPSNSTACYFVMPGIMANYHVMMTRSYLNCNKQVERKHNRQYIKYVANTRTYKRASNSYLVYYTQGHYWAMLSLAVNNSVVLARLLKNKLIFLYLKTRRCKYYTLSIMYIKLHKLSWIRN